MSSHFHVQLMAAKTSMASSCRRARTSWRDQGLVAISLCNEIFRAFDLTGIPPNYAVELSAAFVCPGRICSAFDKATAASDKFSTCYRGLDEEWLTGHTCIDLDSFRTAVTDAIA